MCNGELYGKRGSSEKGVCLVRIVHVLCARVQWGSHGKGDIQFEGDSRSLESHWLFPCLCRCLWGCWSQPWSRTFSIEKTRVGDTHFPLADVEFLNTQIILEYTRKWVSPFLALISEPCGCLDVTLTKISDIFLAISLGGTKEVIPEWIFSGWNTHACWSWLQQISLWLLLLNFLFCTLPGGSAICTRGSLLTWVRTSLEVWQIYPRSLGGAVISIW